MTRARQADLIVTVESPLSRPGSHIFHSSNLIPSSDELSFREMSKPSCYVRFGERSCCALASTQRPVLRDCVEKVAARKLAWISSLIIARDRRELAGSGHDRNPSANKYQQCTVYLAGPEFFDTIAPYLPTYNELFVSLCLINSVHVAFSRRRSCFISQLSIELTSEPIVGYALIKRRRSDARIRFCIANAKMLAVSA